MEAFELDFTAPVSGLYAVRSGGIETLRTVRTYEELIDGAEVLERAALRVHGTRLAEMYKGKASELRAIAREIEIIEGLAGVDA